MRYPTDNNRITSPYGWRYISGKMDFHPANDYGGIVANVDGDPIYSMADDSKVVEIGNNKYRGLYIILEHKTHCTLYQHCKKINFKKGDIVNESDTIAIMGQTGVGSGVHLHFEVRKCSYKNFWDKWENGESKHAIDPELFFMKYMDAPEIDVTDLVKENMYLKTKLNDINIISKI